MTVERHRIEQVASWIVEEYPKPQLITLQSKDAARRRLEIARVHANAAAIAQNGRIKDGPYKALTGYLTEGALLRHLQWFFHSSSPDAPGFTAQYAFDYSSVKQDKNGIDIVVFKRGDDEYRPIGGIEVTQSKFQRAQKESKAESQTKKLGFPILALLAQNVGVAELLEELLFEAHQVEQLPTLGDFIGNRLATRRGDAGLQQIAERVESVVKADQFHKYPEFAEFLGELLQLLQSYLHVQ